MAHPLTDDDLDKINAALEGAKLTEETITRAKSAGIDVADKEQRLIETTARLRAIRQAFFPNS